MGKQEMNVVVQQSKVFNVLWIAFRLLICAWAFVHVLIIGETYRDFPPRMTSLASPMLVRSIIWQSTAQCADHFSPCCVYSFFFIVCAFFEWSLTSWHDKIISTKIPNRFLNCEMKIQNLLIDLYVIISICILNRLLKFSRKKWNKIEFC